MLKKLVMHSLLFTVSMPLGAVYITFERQTDDMTSYVISHSYMNTVRMACLESAEPATTMHTFAPGRSQFILNVNPEDRVEVSVHGQNSSAYNRVFTFYEEPVKTEIFLSRAPARACADSGF